MAFSRVYVQLSSAYNPGCSNDNTAYTYFFLTRREGILAINEAVSFANFQCILYEKGKEGDSDTLSATELHKHKMLGY